MYTHDSDDHQNSFTSGYIDFDCPDTVRRYVINELDEDTNSRMNNLVYVFAWQYYRGGTLYGVYDELAKDPRTGWSQFWGTNKQTVPKVIDITPNDDDSSSDEVPLVAERITFNKQPSGKTCSYVHKSQQAAGSDTYIDLNAWDDDVVSFYLDNGTDITRVDTNENGAFGYGTVFQQLKESVLWSSCESKFPCVCYKESKKEQNPGEGKTEYVFSQPRHTITSGTINAAGNCTCSDDDAIAYSFSGYTSSDATGGDVVQVCASIPETVKILAKIIQWAQILVPMIVIIYSGIDIGKIVVAGNVDEELPKRKKGLIIRGIVMMVFIFLPLFIKVLFSTVFDDNFLGVGGIDCLFTDDLWANEDLTDQYDEQYE